MNGKTFQDPATINDLLIQLESWQYSTESFEIMKEAFELQLMEKMLEADDYLFENEEYVDDGIASAFYSESVDVDIYATEFTEILESKQENIFKRIWNAIKRFFKWIANAFMSLFRKDPDYAIVAKNIDMEDKDLAQKLGEVFDQLEAGLVQKVTEKTRKTGRKGGAVPEKQQTKKTYSNAGFSSKDYATNPRLIITKCLKFVEEGVIEITVPSVVNPGKVKQVLHHFENIIKIMSNAKGSSGSGWDIEGVKRNCTAAINVMEKIKFETVTERYVIKDAKANAEYVKKISMDISDDLITAAIQVKQGSNELNKAREGFGDNAATQSIGEAVTRLQELNNEWMSMMKDALHANGSIIAARDKMYKILKEAEGKHTEKNPQYSNAYQGSEKDAKKAVAKSIARNQRKQQRSA